MLGGGVFVCLNSPCKNNNKRREEDWLSSDLLSSRVCLRQGGSLVNMLREDYREGQKSMDKSKRKEARGTEVSSH